MKGVDAGGLFFSYAKPSTTLIPAGFVRGHPAALQQKHPESVHPVVGCGKVLLKTLPAVETGHRTCTSPDASGSTSADKAGACDPWIRKPYGKPLYN